MVTSRAWTRYQPTYRKKEVETLSNWVAAGLSGSVVGLTGAGKSNLLGFFCHYPGAVGCQLPSHIQSVGLIPVDLNNLPDNSLSTFYRVILRSFYEVRRQFNDELQQIIITFYQNNKLARDPFVSQSALRELLLQLQAESCRTVLVIDRFDEFCQNATPQMTNTLRGLRDSFKDTLSYIMGMRQEAAYLPDPTALGELYEILDTRVCWVGPMSEVDARRLIDEETYFTRVPPTEDDAHTLLRLTGGYPALLKVACHWWASRPDRLPQAEWQEALLQETGIRYRLQEIWDGLSQEERLALSGVQKAQSQSLLSPPKQRRTANQRGVAGAPNRDDYTLLRLAAKGLCRLGDSGWQVFSDLFAAYIETVAGRGLGRLWIDELTGEVYQGHTHLSDLSPLERAVLHFLIRHPKVRHTKTELIFNVWPDELRRQGVTDDSLYQVITTLRKKVEPLPSRPCYIINWRGHPEGGYQLFPEGRPG